VDPTVKCGHIGQQVIDTPWFRRGELEMRLLKEKRAAGEDVNQMAQLFEATTESQQSGSAA